MFRKRPVILCVDDDPDDQLLLLESIRDMAGDVQVACAVNGLEAMRGLERGKENGDLPSLIILDINMPLSGGKETLLTIQKDAVLKNIPVVMFTTSSNPGDKDFCLKNGASRFITKPAKQAEFNQVVKEFLRFLGVKTTA